MSVLDQAHENEFERARATGVLISTASIGHAVYRRWRVACDETDRAELRVRLMPRTLRVYIDLAPTSHVLDADGAAWIADIAPKSGWVKGFTFNGVATVDDFTVSRSRLDEVVTVLRCLASGYGVRAWSAGEPSLARVLPFRRPASC